MSHRVIFFGSPEFAVPSLRSLDDDSRFDVVLVVTQPDRQAGRGRTVGERAVKQVARELELPVWQPASLRSDEAVRHLSSYEPDLFIVVAYGEIFSRALLRIPVNGCLNVHPSLLPRYRGSSPIQAAILNGDHATGVSIIEMVRKLDAGPIVAQCAVPLDGSETGASLGDSLAALAGGILPDVADAWCAGQIDGTPQDDAGATYTRELMKADAQIDWSDPAEHIEREVRAYTPWPTAWTMMDTRRLIIHRVRVDEDDLALPIGTIHTRGGEVLVACGVGSLSLIDVQPEGRPPMAAGAWLRGLRSGTTLHFDLVNRPSQAENG